jgi:hypothetical protein
VKEKRLENLGEITNYNVLTIKEFIQENAKAYTLVEDPDLVYTRENVNKSNKKSILSKFCNDISSCLLANKIPTY